MVTKSPFDSRNSEQALRFCIAAIENGQHIEQVFFYQSGVHNASLLLSPNSDEYDVQQAWLALNKQYDVPLNVCVTAGARRGILESHNNNQIDNIHSCFTCVGLSAFFEKAANAKVIQL